MLISRVQPALDSLKKNSHKGILVTRACPALDFQVKYNEWCLYIWESASIFGHLLADYNWQEGAVLSRVCLIDRHPDEIVSYWLESKVHPI